MTKHRWLRGGGDLAWKGTRGGSAETGAPQVPIPPIRRQVRVSGDLSKLFGQVLQGGSVNTENSEGSLCLQFDWTSGKWEKAFLIPTVTLSSVLRPTEASPGPGGIPGTLG